tara:strand:- start:136 stop:462 length:327 start_codon:yes stop_codon:yes gene_type:complete
MTQHKNINVQQLKIKIDNGDNFILVDVREKFELDIASLPNAIHIPMREIPDNLDKLNTNHEIIVFCKSGIRSMNVCNFMYNNGFKRVFNLTGGIKSWSEEIDESIPIY